VKDLSTGPRSERDRRPRRHPALIEAYLRLCGEVNAERRSGDCGCDAGTTAAIPRNLANKEATARIKINNLLEAAGWRFFPQGNAPANIRLEPSVTITSSDLDVLGENFEKTGKGFIDFLLLDAKGFPLIVLEAKSENKNPLVGKEQARKYAKSLNCRFVILSNGNLHYFWDLERGNPYLITSFPTPDSVIGYQKSSQPAATRRGTVGDDYIVLTQRPNYQSERRGRARPNALDTSQPTNFVSCGLTS
jgi:hypothetical protein